MKKIVCILTALLVMGMAGTAGAEEAAETETVEVYNETALIEDTNYDILLIGTDHRDDSWNGNSDVMILATVIEESERLVMTSFMRDLYADIPDHGVHKLNYAYAVGGAEKLVETLEDNYRLSIDHYAVVDFESMAEVIDIIGGVEMEISGDECNILNGYLVSMDAVEDQLPGGGTYVLNGNQAVAYMRIRYVGNNDYQRTQRQRDILKEIFSSIHDLGVGELAKMAAEVIPSIEHDIGAVEMIKLMTDLPEYVGYELEEARIPYDDLYCSEAGKLVPDFEATIERLHENLEIGE